MSLSPEAAALSSLLEPQLSTYLEELRQLCAIECPTYSKPGVDAAGAWVREWAVAHGWEVEPWPETAVGDGLVATLRGTGHLRVLLAAHLDTVYEIGTAAARPVRIEGDSLIGPGTADNKGGLLSGLYAMAALQSLGWQEHFATISIACGGDEETDMHSSVALLRRLAPAYDVALVLEPGRPNGDLVSARKGIANFTLEVHGKPAHAGVEPQRGIHAILALAHHIIALQALNGAYEGLTINAGTVRGGTRPNVVPEHAAVELDVRVVRAEDMAPVERELAAIAATSPVAGATATLSGGWHFGPMVRTPEVAALAALAGSCAEELGFSVQDVATGGGSYANPLASFGLPVLDGLGPSGGRLHSPDEYISISSIMPRIALLALLMLRHAQQSARSVAP